jgi:hypothetical protein
MDTGTVCALRGSKNDLTEEETIPLSNSEISNSFLKEVPVRLISITIELLIYPKANSSGYSQVHEC